jgi:hypothetical protein
VHFTIRRARERFAERPVGVDQLLCLGVEQDDRCPLNFERIAHLTIKSLEISRLETG